MFFEKVGINNTSSVAEYISNLEIQTYLFIGNLGAGKTSLIKQLVSLWGSAENVTSPTFSLLNQYTIQGQLTIYHSDWYRVKTIEELYDAGIMEHFNEPKSKFLIEWPQLGLAYIPKPYAHIEIEHQENSRNYTITIIE